MGSSPTLYEMMIAVIDNAKGKYRNVRNIGAQHVLILFKHGRGWVRLTTEGLETYNRGNEKWVATRTFTAELQGRHLSSLLRRKLCTHKDYLFIYRSKLRRL